MPDEPLDSNDTEEDAQKQWTYDDLVLHFQTKNEQLRGDYTVLKRMQEFCRGKYGHAPEIPELRD